MLRTALKPAWLLALLGALAAAAAFVGLSRWQFDSARTAAPPPASQTETPVPLTEHVRPGEALLGAQADQVVSARGSFVPGTDVLVTPRLREGQDGSWTVTAFRVDGAPGGEVIPVVRGWSAARDVVDPAPTGEVTLTGRLLPPDGPLPRDTADEGSAAGRQVYRSLSAAQLTNVWDLPAYDSYVVAFPVTDAAGADVSAARPGGLEPVWVGPQPQERQIVWLNVFYGVEWLVFAGFAVFLWWRFVRDAHERELQERALDEEWAAQWRAQELARRREAARVAKEQALAAQAARAAGGSVPPASTSTDEENPA